MGFLFFGLLPMIVATADFTDWTTTKIAAQPDHATAVGTVTISATSRDLHTKLLPAGLHRRRTGPIMPARPSVVIQRKDVP